MKFMIINYFICINVIGFISMYLDKRKAVKSQWRIKESTLIMIAILGGGIGSYLGMETFKHKTKHIKFKYGIPIIIVVQVIIFYILKNCI
ncbi:uncharacterized membrane protein YsdA (DUF1294 family) [Hathewaya limosa]|uniref:Uncharacterized membrane protein YsdA (DUF1294 family) n=2 Tax=Hathewaya limosa TaxID=1536 RepID=A0ABU0JSU8_HATLI|nr:uncharacterized membrane protein YsdA (DUF1294 family) [Hathewaya limosa]